MLVRAVGPGLLPYGVPGFLGNPRREIFRDGAAAPLAHNDDWSADPGAASLLNEAAALAGTFPLSPGSRDAALLLVLPPGAYSARVAGIRGAKEVVQVEICPLGH